jgi:hypothetical protein
MVITFAGVRRFLIGGLVGSILGALIILFLRALLGLLPTFDLLAVLIGFAIGGFIGSMWTTGGFAYLFRDHPPFNFTEPGFWRAIAWGGAGTVAAVLLVIILRSIQGLDATGNGLLLVIAGLFGGFVGTLAGAGFAPGLDTAMLPLSTKPGLARAIPLAILGFMLSAVIVFAIRFFQQMDPIYDARVNLVLAPFIMSFAFIWGMGGFDPRMSEHAHPPHEDHDDKDAIIDPGKAIKADSADSGHHPPDLAANPSSAFGILTGQLWTVMALTMLLIGAFFVLALLPTGLRLDTTADPAASPAIFATNMEFLTPLGMEINDTNLIQADKLTVFAGFIIFTMVSLLAFGGGIAFLFYWLNQGVTTVHGQTSTSIEDPENKENWLLFLLHVPMRLLRLTIEVTAAVSGTIAHGLRQGLPSFFQR